MHCRVCGAALLAGLLLATGCQMVNTISENSATMKICTAAIQENTAGVRESTGTLASLGASMDAVAVLEAPMRDVAALKHGNNFIRCGGYTH